MRDCDRNQNSTASPDLSPKVVIVLAQTVSPTTALAVAE